MLKHYHDHASTGTVHGVRDLLGVAQPERNGRARVVVALAVVATLLAASTTVGASDDVGATASVDQVITTIVGGGQVNYIGELVPDTSDIDAVTSADVAPNGDILFAERGRNIVKRKRASDGVVEVVAGTGAYANGGEGEGGPANQAPLNLPAGAVANAAGDIFIADAIGVRRIDHDTGTITTIYTPWQSFAPSHLWMAPDESLYVTTTGYLDIDWERWTTTLRGAKVHRISPTGLAVTVAGVDNNSTCTMFGGCPPCGAPHSAELCGPRAAVVDPAGDVFVADGPMILRYPAGGGPRAVLATFPETVVSMTAAADGTLYVIRSGSASVDRVDPTTGAIDRVAGTGVPGFNGDGRPATETDLSPSRISFDPQGRLVIADAGNHRIRRLEPVASRARVVGKISSPGQTLGGHVVSVYRTFPLWERVAHTTTAPDGSFQLTGLLPGPHRIRIDDPFLRSRTTWLTDQAVQRSGAVFELAEGTTTTLTPVLSPRPTGAIDGTVTADLDDRPLAGVWVQVLLPSGYVAGTQTDASGHFAVGGLAPGAYRVRFVDLSGTYPREWYHDALGFVTSEPVNVATSSVTVAAHLGPSTLADIKVVRTIAGDGTQGCASGGGMAVDSPLADPLSIAVGPDGSLYIADRSCRRVRRVGPLGRLTTYAGNGVDVSDGDGGLATAAAIGRPGLVAVDDAGNVFIADGSNRIRRVDAATRQITTVAGGGTGTSFDQPATDLGLVPADMAFGPDGWLYVVDRAAPAPVIRIDPDTLDVEPVLADLDGPWSANVASLTSVHRMAFGPDGSLYLAGRPDGGLPVVVRWVPGTGARSVVAGRPTSTDRDGDGLAATSVGIDPSALGVDADGNVYLTEDHGRIRMVERSSGLIVTVAGNGTTGYDPSVALALDAPMRPSDLVVRADTLYYVDMESDVVRVVEASG